MNQKISPGDLVRLKFRLARRNFTYGDEDVGTVLVCHYDSDQCVDYPVGTLCTFVRTRKIPGTHDETGETHSEIQTCSEILLNGRLGWVYNSEIERLDEAG